MPLTKLFEDAGHITALPPARRNGLLHTASVPAAMDDTVMGASPRRSSADSGGFPGGMASAPGSFSGVVRSPSAGGAPQPLPPHHSGGAASTHYSGHPSSGGHAYGGAAPASTATSLPAAVAGGLAGLAQRLPGMGQR